MADNYEVTTLEQSGAASVAFSPDEARIYVARPDGMIDVFDVATRTVVDTWDIGTNLGGLSVSEDGSFLLVVERSINTSPPYPGPQMSTVYRVDTATGHFTTYTQPGNAYLDVEIVDGDTALLSGGQTQVQRLDLATGTFSAVANSVYYGNYSIMVEDQHLTLLAELGISNGPLFLYDDRTDTIVAQGDNYQTMGAGSGSIGSNFGHQAVSEAAGLVAQFAQNTINLYDLTLDYLRDLDIPERPDGMAFDPTGTYLFVRLTTGPLMQYEVATGALIASFALSPTEWHNNAGAADQITFSADGTLILVHDNSSGKLQLIDLEAHPAQHDGSAGADALAGGRGDDTYLINHAGDTITEFEHEGNDTALASVSFTLPVYVENLTLTGTATHGTGNQLANVIGGNDLDNVLVGNGGADMLSGEAGNDTLIGGTGNDALAGGAGNDSLWGENGDDTLDGGAGDDIIRGGNSDDTAYVTGGTTSSDTGTDWVDLGYATADGNPQTGGDYEKDHLIVDYSAMTQNVTFHGTYFADYGPSFGSTGAEARIAVGGEYRLTFYGVGVLTVTTGSGNDKVYAVSTQDIISTGAGDDIIYDFSQGNFLPSRTRIDGGSGIDVANWVNWGNLAEAVVLDLNDPNGVTIGAGDAERYLRGLESLYGVTFGAGNDAITLHASGALQNVIWTEWGDDTVTVFGGTNAANTGYTNIDMGSGADDLLIADFSAALQQVVFTADGGYGNTSIGGVQHHNYSNVERYQVTTGAGDDVIDARNSYGASVFRAGDGADTIYGAGADDMLFGGAGDDTLVGGHGNDTLDGGAGFDVAVFAGNASVYSWSVVDGVTNVERPGQSDSLTGIERMQFGNAAYEYGPTGEFAAPLLITASFGAGASAGGWSSQRTYPRTLTDLNGDGFADLVGFGDGGVFAALADDNGAFGAAFLALNYFGADASAGGWSDNRVYPRSLADIDGDGRADLVGFGAAGVYAALSTSGGAFGQVFLAEGGYGADPAAGGWSDTRTYPRLLADVNGDGKDDLVGFGDGGVHVSLAVGGGSFAQAILGTSNFGAGVASGGWSNDDTFPRTLADVNGDGAADIVAFGSAGVQVALANGDGTFAAPSLAFAGFGAEPSAGGWTSNNLYYRTVGDLDGDGHADLVGFGDGGVYAAYGDGAGHFATAELVVAGFGAGASAGGWTSQDLYPRMLADLNGDGAADLVGFGDGGVIAATSVSDWVLA